MTDASPTDRPSWDAVWMDLALTLARRSTCARLSVGCVVVSLDNTRVLSLGYNGGPRGLQNGCLSTEPGNCGCIHAETNSLLKLDYAPGTSRAYVTTAPCWMCAVALVNAGVREVVYGRDYRLRDGLDLLARAGVAVRQFLPEEAT